MKKFLYYIALSAIIMLPFSCTDMLEEESQTDVEKKNYMNNAKEAEKVLLGVYQTTSEDAVYGYHLSIYFNMGTDIAQGEGNSAENWRIVPVNAFPTTQVEVQTTYQKLYNGIYNANDFLERISVKMQSYSITDQKLATIYIAEARALRAWFYFELIRRYGNVPLMTNTAMSNQAPSTFVQAHPNDVYNFIENDLKYASSILPYATDDQYRSNNEYRISKGAVLGLLTKVYATWAGEPLKETSKWENAAQTARVLIESGKHTLLSSYEQLWKNTCNGVWDPTESLLEITFYSPTGTLSSDPTGRIGKWNGVKTTAIAGTRGSCGANYKVVHTFALDWRKDEGDLRRDLSIANYQYTNTKKLLYAANETDSEEEANRKDKDPKISQRNKQNYTPAKWDIEKYVTTGKLINNDKSNVNWYFLRYADVLLLYAEAINEWKHGPTTEAYEAINMVRRRGYGKPINVASSACDLKGLDEKGFREAIQKERAYELAFEGHRRMDLVRWGIYYTTIQNTKKALREWWSTEGYEPNYPVHTYTIEGKHELLPIPQREMDLCEQFEQNPGW